MQLYTITATPVQNAKQYKESLGAAMPSDKMLSDSEVNKFNALALKEYPQAVAQVLANFGIDGFTMYQVNGYWKSQAEASYKIELALDDDSNDGGANARATAEMIAQELATKYNQEAVMLTLPDNSVHFIEQ